MISVNTGPAIVMFKYRHDEEGRTHYIVIDVCAGLVSLSLTLSLSLSLYQGVWFNFDALRHSARLLIEAAHPLLMPVMNVCWCIVLQCYRLSSMTGPASVLY